MSKMNPFDQIGNSLSVGGLESSAASPLRHSLSMASQKSLNAHNFPQGSHKENKIFNYLFSSSVDPQDQYKSPLSMAGTPVNPSAGLGQGYGGNLNAMSFIIPGNSSFYPSALGRQTLHRHNTNEDDFDSFALSNPNDIML
jgi:hypothetical protein